MLMIISRAFYISEPSGLSRLDKPWALFVFKNSATPVAAVLPVEE
jgi:hypothetical protein